MNKNDIDTLQGNWLQIGYERDGIISLVDVEQGWNPLTKISGLNFTVTIANGETVLVGTFILNSEQQPKEINWTDTSGSYASDGTIKAIYTLTETEFVFCASCDETARPTEFKTKPGQVLRRMKRLD